MVAQTPFVWQVNVLVPETQGTGAQAQANVAMDMDFTAGATAVGPFAVEPVSLRYSTLGTPLSLALWVIP